ncbi:hypothetical protein AYJ54_28590 [Bradyrhizobium centrolobii]|uniref:Uncharacterized protein n=1 Tax=Bradyrhizobium centrolobii TaxID=1505087 RepID=A0A176YCC5_9BRAD|nr:hypothetical protein AYJ54_28590 [Bradyrhizobium centrolobii]
MNLGEKWNLQLLAGTIRKRTIQVICKIWRHSMAAVLVFKLAILRLSVFSTVLAYTLILGF